MVYSFRLSSLFVNVTRTAYYHLSTCSSNGSSQFGDNNSGEFITVCMSSSELWLQPSFHVAMSLSFWVTSVNSLAFSENFYTNLLKSSTNPRNLCSLLTFSILWKFSMTSIIVALTLNPLFSAKLPRNSTTSLKGLHFIKVIWKEIVHRLFYINQTCFECSFSN